MYTAIRKKICNFTDFLNPSPAPFKFDDDRVRDLILGDCPSSCYDLGESTVKERASYVVFVRSQNTAGRVEGKILFLT